MRAFTDTLQLASTLYTNNVGYNQYYNKPYTTFSDVFSKVKGEIPVFNRKPVIPEVNLKVDINGKTITETTKGDSLVESWNRNTFELKMYKMDDLANLKHTENFTE